MRFERTKGGILNFSSGTIPADGFLDMLVRMTQDVYEANGITAATELKVSDPKALLMNLHNLNSTLIAVYKNNTESVSQFSGLIQKRIQASAGELAAQEQELAELAGQICKEEAARAELERTHAKLEKSRGHLLRVKEECDSLRQRIGQLSDSRLDDMAAEKGKLDAELRQREKKARELDRQLIQVCQSLDKAQKENDSIQREMDKARRTQEALEQDTQEAQSVLESRNREMEQLRQKLETIRREMEELGQRNAEFLEAYQEASAAQTVIRNAVCSARNDILIPGNLFAQAPGSPAVTIENQPDLDIAGQSIQNWEELLQWFLDLDQRISGLLEVYRAGMAELSKAAQSLTSQKE